MTLVTYLVLPRGDEPWVQRLRASGRAQLTGGDRRESITVVEVDDDEKPAVLRAFLRRKAEAGERLGRLGPDSTDEELRRIAPKYRVFRIGS